MKVKKFIEQYVIETQIIMVKIIDENTRELIGYRKGLKEYILKDEKISKAKIWYVAAVLSEDNTRKPELHIYIRQKKSNPLGMKKKYLKI